MLELLGRFGRDFWTRMIAVDCIGISKVWTTGMLVAVEGPPDKRAGAPTSSKVIQLAMQSLGPLHLAEVP